MTSAWENSVQLCVDDLRQRLPVRCVLVAGVCAGLPQSWSDLDLCVVSAVDVHQRLRKRVDGLCIDIFVVGEKNLRRSLQGKGQDQFPWMLRAAKHFWGDIAISEEFQILARQKMSRPVSAAPPDVVYRFRSEPFTLIRRFRHVSANDALTASVLVATLIRALLDAYGILNRICSMPSTELLNFLAARDPRAASALKRVVESSQQELREHPELLSELAEAIVGKEDRDEFAEPQRTHEGDSHIPPWLKSEATRASQQRTRSGAIKSYEANQRLSEEAVGNIHA